MPQLSITKWPVIKLEFPSNGRGWCIHCPVGGVNYGKTWFLLRLLDYAYWWPRLVNGAKCVTTADRKGGTMPCRRDQLLNLDWKRGLPITRRKFIFICSVITFLLFLQQLIDILRNHYKEKKLKTFRANQSICLRRKHSEYAIRHRCIAFLVV